MKYYYPSLDAILLSTMTIKLIIYRPKWCKNVVACTFMGIKTYLELI